MSLELPTSFVLDSSGELAEALQEDAPSALIDIELEILPSRCGKVIMGAADLLVCNAANRAESFRHGAFTAAGSMACEAFMKSDAPVVLRNRTIKSFSMADMPLQLLSRDPDETLEAFCHIAREGHTAHPELRHHTDIVMEYYAEAAQLSDIGRVAFCGSGFAIYQLDLAWQRSRNSLIDDVWQAEIGTWDIDRAVADEF